MNKGQAARARPSLLIRSLLVASLVALGLMIAPAANADGGLDWTVTNYDNDGTHGVYLRNSADINNVSRDAAHYVLYGTKVHLLCGAFGSAVGPHANTAWDQVRVTSGPNTGLVAFISEHWINTPVATNQHVSGEPSCTGDGSPSPAPTSGKAQAAINWATARLGSTAYNGLCLKFTRLAYAAGGVSLPNEVSVTWGTNTYPQDIWGHFRAGRTGTGTPPAGALVFYLAKAGHSKIYSHITIATAGSGNTISTNDTVNRSYVHRETIAQHSSSGAYNYYAGWWLP